ncbi:MAG TPA: hypothetical protein VE035_18420, partial [Puia sp.]|nr:hypothetical protein [Puia sp.]
MDLLFFPQPVQKDRKLNSRIVHRYYTLPTPGNFQYSGFYYIGKKTTHIEKLVNMYKRGYASEGLENAKAELLRSLEQEKNVLPEVIICEASFDFSSIRIFCEFLRGRSNLDSIPFILDGSGLSEKELNFYRKHTKPDEILFIHDANEQVLNSKIQFLRKMKEAHKNSVKPRIEESLPKSRLNLGFLSKRIFDILASS